MKTTLNICAGVMIASQLGTFVVGMLAMRHNPQEWHNATLALLFAIANTIIFFL